MCKLIRGYPEGLCSNVPRKETRAAFAQTMGKARSSDLLYLFNLKTEPNETVNLAHDKKEVVKPRSLERSQRLMRKCVAHAAYAPGFSSSHLVPSDCVKPEMF